jgi:superkiller protein 3
MRFDMVSRVLIVFLIAGLSTACGASRQHKQVQDAGESLRYELAELYVGKNARQAAVPLLQKILAENPKDIRARVLYGKVLRDQGLYPEAAKHIRFALKLDSNYADAHAAIGILYDLQRKPHKALLHHIMAVRLAPGVAAYRNNLGFSFYGEGKIDQAITQLERSLALDPALGIAYNNLGFAYGRAGRFDEAKRTFRQALTEAGTLVNMAMIYDEHERSAEAELSRAQAYDLDPDLKPETL